MTQKTNQFNLTTKRYTDADVKGFLAEGWKIWCISVADKFGDNGITGCMMVTPQGEIDTCLLSCRILGKGIEVAFIKRVLAMLKESGFAIINSVYRPTAKNTQVAEFYDNIGFSVIGTEESGVKYYEIDLLKSDLSISDCYHIEIKQ